MNKGKDKKQKEKDKPKKGLRKLLFGGSSAKKKDKEASNTNAKASSDVRNEQDRQNQDAVSLEQSAPPLKNDKTGAKSSTTTSSLFSFGRKKKQGSKPTTSSKASTKKGAKSTENNASSSSTRGKENKVLFQVKKGKKPKFRKVERLKTPRLRGDVQRVKNRFYPGTVTFKYTTPKPVWVPMLGRTTALDFGNEARMIRDDSDE